MTGLLAAAARAWRDGKGWAELPGDALAFALAGTLSGRGCLVVVDEPDMATRVQRGLKFFVEQPARVELFPADDVKPYDGFSPGPDVLSQRARVLWRLDRGESLVIVAPARALMQVVPDAEARAAATVAVSPGARLDRDELVRRLTEVGYLAAPYVDRPGFFAVRGDVVDVWSVGRSVPWRVDLFDDEIEEVRRLDPGTQRASVRTSQAVVLPAREEHLHAAALLRCQVELARLTQAHGRDPRHRRRVLDELRAGIRFTGVEGYLPALVGTQAPLAAFEGLPRVLVHPQSVTASLREGWASASRRWRELPDEDRPIVPPEERYVPDEVVLAGLADALPVYELSGPERAVRLGAHSVSGYTVRGSDLAPSASKLRKLAADGVRVALVARDTKRAEMLEGLLEAHDLRMVGRASPLDAKPGEVTLLIGDLPMGFVADKDGWAFIPATALFGGQHRTEAARRAHELFDVSVSSVAALKEGDLVVHRLHGVGRFVGLMRLEPSRGVRQDFVQLEYRGGDTLYVPATELGVLSKFTPSSADLDVTLDKLGGLTWARRKEKVRDALLERAHEMMALHAKRELATRPGVEPVGELYRAFVSRFPYQETPDQAQAIVDIEADLESDVPMDRLLCGDVGFGKTEVAMRAAIRVVCSGRQVVFLCPTTVLAFQHFLTLRERVDGFPVRVEMLSRFSSPADARAVVDGLAAGTVDIVVGTHRLLARDVRFAHLGLAIVDEEHRFGVSQKDRLRKLRAEVDVLSMSATPIPRTLQMALSGVREMSIMATPPTERLPVRTMVARSTETRVREAIVAELARNGQVYFVHNRIESIETVRNRLEEWVPEARFRVAHGQMDGEQLEEILLSFMRHEFDVLVCTAIVESGVDLPNVNTMLIDRAERFGLSQLYQLRGRVGRSSVRGDCILLTPEELPRDAQRRLQVLVENTRLGSGFAVAAADLELRGAGNFLGQAQSGQIDSVGYETWVQLLEEAVREAKGVAERERIEIEVDVPCSAFIPDDLVPDLQRRLGWYRRLSDAARERDLDEALDELRAEAGGLPDEVQNLAGLITTKLLCRPLGVVRCDWLQVRVVLELHPHSPLDEAALARLAAEHPKRLTVRADRQGVRRIESRFTPREAEKPFRYLRWLLAQVQRAAEATG